MLKPHIFNVRVREREREREGERGWDNYALRVVGVRCGTPRQQGKGPS